MANLPIVGGAFVINAVNAYVLPGANATGVGTKTIQLVTLVTPVGVSITVQGRVAGSNAGAVPIPYRKRYLNGAVGDDTTSTSAAITSDSLIEVDCTGIDVILNCTALTSGSLSVYTKDVIG